MDSNNGFSALPKTKARNALNTKSIPEIPENFSPVPSASHINLKTKPIGCRSSANYVSAAMAKFDDRKRDLVRSIGFGGLLEIHEMTKVNRSFSHWLLSATNWENGVITAGQHIKMKIVSDDVEKILGIPGQGRHILASAIKEEDKHLFMEKHLAFLGPESALVENAESILEKDLSVDFSKQEADQFKIAFVIFVMGRFLAPTTVFNQGNYNFWHALVDPDEIKEFNWCDYILSCLLDSARVLFCGTFLKKPPASVTGCPLVLQIFYLDNIELGPLNLKHDVFPRIKAYNSSILAKLIQADTDNQTELFGCSKMRHQEDSCYALPDASELLSQHASPSSGSRPSTFQKKRRYQAVSQTPKTNGKTVSGIPSSPPIISSSLGANFPAYIRSNYPEYVQHPFIEALRYHNARCIQHITKHKNALAAAIVTENMALADKYVEHSGKPSPSGIPKYPKKATPSNRKSFEDFLSGPDSGSEAEEKQQRQQVELNTSTPIGFLTPHFRQAANNHDLQGAAQPLCDQATMAMNKEKVLQPTGQVNHTINHCREAGPSNVPDKVVDDLQTPAATSKMQPLSPQHSPTELNRMNSNYDLTLRMLSSWVDMDLNSRPLDAEYNNSPVVKKIVKIGRFARSHWSLGVDHPERDPSVTGSLYEWVSTTNSDELDRNWIVHDSPRYIACKGHVLKKDFFSTSGLSYDLFDICVRRLLQLDNLIYPEDSPLRWRHILESDFAMHVLGGENPSGSKAIKDQFIGPGVCSQLHRCRMFFIPVQGKGVWWSYAIDLRENSVYIIDPSVDNNDTSYVLEKHSGTVNLILESLKNTIINLFDGWQLDCDGFDYVVVKTTTSGCPRDVSAFYTLYCLKNFEGDNTIHVSESIISKFKQTMMYELFGLKENRGNLPLVYVQTIDD